MNKRVMELPYRQNVHFVMKTNACLALSYMTSRLFYEVFKNCDKFIFIQSPIRTTDNDILVNSIDLN